MSAATATETSPGTLICTRCSRARAVDQFRRLKKGAENRSHWCRHCHNEYENVRRRAKNREERQRALDRFNLEVKNATCVAKIESLVDAAFQEFGGQRQFTAEWARQLRIAADQKPGSKKVLDGILAVMSMAEKADALRREQQQDSFDDSPFSRPLEEWSDEDLHESQESLERRMVLRMLASGRLAEILNDLESVDSEARATG